MAATKSDLETVDQRLRAEMRGMEERLRERIDLKTESTESRMVAALEQGLGALRQEMGDLRKEMSAQLRVHVYTTLTAVVTVDGLAIAAGRLA